MLLTIATDEENLLKTRLSQKPYFSRLSFCAFSACEQEPHLICYTERTRLPEGVACTLALLPASAAPDRLPRARVAVTYGMAGRDTLSFSSIGENDALLCLTRSVRFGPVTLEAMDVRVDYDHARSITDNLVGAFCCLLTDLLFASEETALEVFLDRTERECADTLLP